MIYLAKAIEHPTTVKKQPTNIATPTPKECIANW